MSDAERRRRSGRRTVVLIDEIHRFNKAQQDAFLPYVERGDIILIGATTENPSFEVIAALLSRTKVYSLRALTAAEVVSLLARALSDRERGLGEMQLEAPRNCLSRSRSTRTAMPAPPITSWSWPRPPPQASNSPGRRSRTRSRGRFFSTTRPARSTTTSSRRYTNPCDRATRMPPSTGWLVCSRPGGPAVHRPAARAHGDRGHRFG